MKKETREKIAEAARASVLALEAAMQAESSRYRYREGKTSVVVHLTPDEHEALISAMLILRQTKRLRRDDNRPLAISDVVKEAIRRLCVDEANAPQIERRGTVR